ncbi:MAG TPA: hypothetical protein VHX87_07190 [Galbitalea sp.]|nr:hypothetical protein [Galbitalea sp.]
MSKQNYPADAGAETYLLTVLGTPNSSSPAGAKDLHNQTAGNPGGVAAAKSLGDLSHNVFLPLGKDDKRLLFMDTWNSPTGLGQFFSDEQVQQGGNALFADREAVLWMPAAGFGSYSLPVPSGKSVAAVGLMRAPVSSYEAAADAFHADSAEKANASRQLGQIAHQLWVPVPMGGPTPATEVLGVDYWLDEKQMNQWYAGATYDHLGPVFTGAPATSTWKPAGGSWVEW